MSLSAFKSFMLLTLQERITTAVPAIRYVAKDFKQLDIYDVRPAVSFPCVLVKFPRIKFDQYLEGMQSGDAVIQLRIATNPFSSSNSLSPEAVKEQALQIDELENQVYLALQGWNDANNSFQPLNRIEELEEERQDQFNVTRQIFTTSYMDDGADDTSAGVSPGLNLTGEIE